MFAPEAESRTSWNVQDVVFPCGNTVFIRLGTHQSLLLWPRIRIALATTVAHSRSFRWHVQANGIPIMLTNRGPRHW